MTASLIHERLLGLDTSIVTTFDQAATPKQVRHIQAQRAFPSSCSSSFAVLGCCVSLSVFATCSQYCMSSIDLPVCRCNRIMAP